ncbi:hypothetical protein SAMN06298216_1509 [Spirosomataceae bacterium TFI 002]|nr:hypothetical protein SAMN06298216_1509 [Spirosomataceae bacterium TFI 002]
MKKLVLIFILPLLSCNGSTSTENLNTENRDKVTATENSDLKNQVACETFKPSDLASIFEWDVAAISSESMGHSEGKRSICRFAHQSDILWVRFGWKSEKAIENKVLETQYKGYLNNGENGITYESVEGNSMLIGQKPADAANPKLFIFRKRFDNKAEVTFEFYSNVKSKEEALNVFKTLLGKV